MDENYVDTNESNINALLLMALEKVPFIPFTISLETWRWEVFDGMDENDWNTRWWELRKEYQQIVPPSERDNDAFDPGSKYHIAANSQIIR